MLAQGNLFDEKEDHRDKLLADTKQVNQFFRRFNGTETKKGDRLYETDRQYQSKKLRADYLPILFDFHSAIDNKTKERFVEEVIDKKSPKFLDFHSDTWTAEVKTSFQFKGEEVSIILFMEVQQQGQGYEWVIADLIFEPFKEQFLKDTSNQKSFIHPMSHELDFMNLRKAFQEGVATESFTKRSFEPDFVTLFVYEMNRGNLRFKTVENVKFHFFSIGGWYFELTKFNRSSLNSGWLISNLVQIDSEQKKQLKAFIYDK
ncbi:MAG: hypothetical protein JXR03_12990 [Cyclobacteriaceae bacterium]